MAVVVLKVVCPEVLQACVCQVVTVVSWPGNGGNGLSGGGCPGEGVNGGSGLSPGVKKSPGVKGSPGMSPGMSGPVGVMYSSGSKPGGGAGGAPTVSGVTGV